VGAGSGAFLPRPAGLPYPCHVSDAASGRACGRPRPRRTGLLRGI